MILIVLAGLCLLTVPLTGGRLGRLTDLRLRAIWISPLALALQLTVTTVAPGGNRSLHVAIHIATYGLIGIFLWVNRHISGVAVIATGALLNGWEIVINGGVMPASATAQRIAGLRLGPGFNNSAQLAHPHLLWLGDVIPVPGPLPNVLSAADLIIFAGMLVLLHRACGKTATVAQSDPTPPATESARVHPQRVPGVQI